MQEFKELIKDKGRLVLALDLKEGGINEGFNILKDVHKYIVALKVNLHLLIPLSLKELKELNDFVHKFKLASIADLKLNDISSTNLIAAKRLWEAGFDAIIVNPIAGYKDGLGPLIEDAHKIGKGIIALVYMRHKGAEEFYGMNVGRKKLYQLFLEKAVEWKLDGVVIGAGRLEVIREAKEMGLPIFSPGSITQGADLVSAIKAGVDYIIIGRAIVYSDEPKEAAKKIYETLAQI